MEKALASKEEVLALKSQLEKSLKEKDEAKSEEILDTLKKYKVAEKLQKDTRINILLTRLLTHESEMIKNKAKNVMAGWRGKSPTRASITKEMKKDNGEKIKKASESTAKKTSSPSLRSSGSGLKLSANTIKTKNAERTKFIELIAKALLSKEIPKELNVDVNKLSEEIEEALWNKHTSDYDAYLHHYRSISFSIKDKANEWLHRDIIQSKISPVELIDHNILELASEQRKAERKTAEEEMNFDRFLACDYEGESDLFTCGKCKKSRTTYKQLQTRSADEPMTTFIKCLECGNRWKQC